mgnify:CR=1 FL=1
MDNRNYRSYHGADCDPADCNYDNSPEEFAEDFIVETEYGKTNGFVTPPEEYPIDANMENSQEFGPEHEQAATTDDNNNFDGAYGTTTDLYVTETNDNSAETANDNDMPYDSETSEEFSDEFETTANKSKNEFGYDVTESYDPNDETAATIDEWYTTDKPSARERCELDDYEIISDVLGSEKQIVKLYSTALCEAAEEPFRNLIRENLDEAAADQFKAFEFMQQRGMYKTEQATEQNITEAKQQFGPLCRNCGCDNCCD